MPSLTLKPSIVSHSGNSISVSRMVAESDQNDLHGSDRPRSLSKNDPEKIRSLKSHIEDSMVSGYVDPTISLDPAENARLVRKIHWQ